MNFATYAHFLTHALRLRYDRRHRVPLTMNVQLLRACPFSCRYCAQSGGSEAVLDLELLKDVMLRAWRMGGRRIHLTGGEPLLRDDLAEIVSFGKGLGFFVSIATNGYDAEKQIKALEMADRVMLSLDGPSDAVDFLSGPGSAKVVDKALALFRAHRIPFWTTTVITRINAGDLEWVVDQAGGHGSQANFVLFATQPEDDGVRLHPRKEDAEDLMLTEAETRETIRTLIRLKKEGKPVGSSLPYLKELLAWSDYEQLCSPAPSKRYRCLAWRSVCEILADGNLYSCDWTMKNGRGVSLHDKNFTEAFRSLPEITDCRSCANSCCLESNLIFNLNPSAILNWMGRMRR